MNWKQHLVSQDDLRRLREYNEPIPVQRGELPNNSGVELYTLTGERMDAIYDPFLGAIRKLNGDNPVFSVMKNRDLLLYNDLLANVNINTIIVDGFFGTGKTSTVCSHLVTGMVAELEGKPGGIPCAYLSKPHEPLGKEYGHLPGDLEDKTAEEFVSYTQYFERFGQPFLVDKLRGKLTNGNGKPTNPKMLHIMVFQYLRGRDIESGWVVLDEAQNTDRKEMSSFVSRVGDRSKLIIVGDSTGTQIDKKGNTADSNGLTFVKQTYVDKKYSGYVEMQTIGHILRGQRVRDLFKALRG